MFIGLQYGRNNPQFLPETSPRKTNLKYKPVQDSDEERFHKNDNRVGYYFCADELPVEQNLKLGTFTDAENNCSLILTPDVCNDKLLVDQLVESARKFAKLKDGFDQMHRFWTGSRRVSDTDFIDEKGEITSNPYCNTSQGIYAYGNYSVQGQR